MFLCTIANFLFWSEADADFIVDDLSEIPVIIKKMNNVYC